LDKSEWENFKLDDEDEESGSGQIPAQGKTIRQTGKAGEDGNKSIRKVDLYLDSMLSRVTGTYERSAEKIEELRPRVRTRVKKVATSSTGTIKKINALGDEYSEKIFQKKLSDIIIDQTIKRPLMVLLVIFLLTGVIAFFGIAPEQYGGSDLQSKIHGEFDVQVLLGQVEIGPETLDHPPLAVPANRKPPSEHHARPPGARGVAVFHFQTGCLQP